MSVETLTPPQERPVLAGQRPAAKRTAAQFIVEQLRLWNVERIYGVIGDTNFRLLDELGKQQSIRYIPCRHEGGAALMASAESKLTGRLTVCLATSGPGIANLLNGLADAAADRTPVLAITGQVETSKLGTHSKQYIDQQKLIAAIAGRSELVVHPDALPELLERAMVQAVTMGQVTHLSIPTDLYNALVPGEPKPYSPHLHQPLLADSADISKLTELIASADRPVLYVGRGIAGCRDEVRQLAETIGAPVITTLPARSLFPNDHELYAGGLGQAGSEAASTLLGECDLIVQLGATWWPEEYVPEGKRIAQVDRNAAAIGIGRQLALGLTGDLAQVIPQLAGDGRLAKRDRTVWKRRAIEATTAWKRAIESESRLGGSPIAPQTIMNAVARKAAEDAVIAVDTGDHTLWFNRIFQTKPDQRVLVSGRWRTLGFALPAAVAAKLSQPKRQAIAIAGDGGTVQTILEFQTAAEQKLPLVLIVLNNGSYAMEKNRMEAGGMQTVGSAIAAPDFAKLAEALGGLGLRAGTPEELEQCIDRALGENRPVLVDAVVEPTVVPHTKP